MHAFVERLKAAAGMGARALEFAILTASRTGPCAPPRGKRSTWPLPCGTARAEIMKSGRPHRVPLSPRAVELLQALPRFEVAEGELIWCSLARKGKPLSDMSLTAVMRRMGLSAVPHGFRSTFSDWCAERTATPPKSAKWRWRMPWATRPKKPIGAAICSKSAAS
jgi:integrase